MVSSLIDGLACFLRRPELQNLPFVFAIPDHGRMVITAAGPQAEMQGLTIGMVCRQMQKLSFRPASDRRHSRKELKLLTLLGGWCIRYTPIVRLIQPNGLILDISGCSHLWGGEKSYLEDVLNRLRSKGFDVQAAIADTVGAAWAIARFGKAEPIIEPGAHAEALLSLPPAALRLEELALDRLQKLGLRSIRSFIGMQRSALMKALWTTPALKA